MRRYESKMQSLLPCDVQKEAAQSSGNVSTRILERARRHAERTRRSDLRLYLHQVRAGVTLSVARRGF